MHLTAYTDNDGPASTVILSGAVGDYGKAVRHGQLDLMLTRGSFRLDIADLDKRFVALVAHLQVDIATCSGTASVSGPVPVASGSGTGSYKNIRGTFTLTVTLDEVYQRGGCGETSPYLAQAIVIAGPGAVSIG